MMRSLNPQLGRKKVLLNSALNDVLDDKTVIGGKALCNQKPGMILIQRHHIVNVFIGPLIIKEKMALVLLNQ